MIKFNKKKYKSVKFREALRMYDYMLARHFDKNKIKLESVSEDLVYIDSGVQSKEYYTEYYLVNLPRTVLIGEVSEIINQFQGRVSISVVSIFSKHVINWESPEMQARMDVFKNFSEEQKTKQIDTYNLRSNYKSAQVEEWLDKSLKYLNIANLEYDCSTWDCFFLIIVKSRIEDLVSFENTKALLEKFMGTGNRGYWFEKIQDIKEVIKHIPIGNEAHLVNTNKQILTDELISRLYEFKDGTIGKTGILLGFDLNNQPIFKVFKRDGVEAENILVVCETGGGKGVIVKNMLYQFIAYNYFITINDVEGDEYDAWINYINESNPGKAGSLSLGEGSETYYETMEIPNLTGDIEIDRSLKIQASNFTKVMFMALLQGIWHKSTWVNSVIERAISDVYTEAGVDNDFNTWINSKGLKLAFVYEKIKQYINKEVHVDDFLYTEEDFIYASKLIIAELYSYFDSKGRNYSYFRKPLTIDDINKTRVLQVCYHMRGKTDAMVDPVHMAIMQLTGACISYQRSIYAKYVEKTFNAKIWEEINRFGGLKGAEEMLNTGITGNRKLGDIGLIITNKPSAIVNSTDKVHGDLLQNISSVLVGAIDDADIRKKLLARLSISEYEAALDRITRESKRAKRAKNYNIKIESPYLYSFLIGVDKSEYSIGKVLLPKSLLKSELYSTGVDMNGNRRN